MKGLKMGQGKVLYFIQLFLYYILFGENSIGLVKGPLYSVRFNLNHEKKKNNNNQNVNVEKIVAFVKTFDYYHRKFNFGNFSAVL